MNDAHVHLILVHVPIVLVPAALIVYLIGVVWRSKPVALVGLNGFIAAAVCAVAAYIFGEGAEEIVEKISGISEDAIEAHEDTAVYALWCSLALGIVSCAHLVMTKMKIEVARLLTPIVILLGIVAAASLAYTANLGGKIRHPEAFGALPQSAEAHDG